MKVDIIEIKSGKVVATYPVFVRGLNYEPTEEEYIETAWRCAIEDDMVDADRKGDYRFRLPR